MDGAGRLSDEQEARACCCRVRFPALVMSPVCPPTCIPCMTYLRPSWPHERAHQRSHTLNSDGGHGQKVSVTLGASNCAISKQLKSQARKKNVGTTLPRPLLNSASRSLLVAAARPAAPLLLYCVWPPPAAALLHQPRYTGVVLGLTTGGACAFKRVVLALLSRLLFVHATRGHAARALGAHD